MYDYYHLYIFKGLICYLNTVQRIFLSFNEGVEVSFRLNSSCPISISKGKNYTNVLCVKGANGSGKSNILKILDFFI
jgi:AAA15 family ATPase/GTPase